MLWISGCLNKPYITISITNILHGHRYKLIKKPDAVASGFFMISHHIVGSLRIIPTENLVIHWRFPPSGTSRYDSGRATPSTQPPKRYSCLSQTYILKFLAYQLLNKT